ncbi:hypothetical protein [Primorskyibacter sp. 2E107]|uniref:hypothetical protein n=1 Tax=Primorskyibacter sp. 2E107 TaxID=3403458 RepID=UPI003AF43A7C
MAESVDWTRDAPCPAPDPLADIPDCPFAQLRHYLEAALQGNPHAGMVCDEEGGLVHEASEEDYEPVIVTPSLIRPLALLFHDGIGPWAMRRFTVVHDPVA